jgi:hypothetical protein
VMQEIVPVAELMYHSHYSNVDRNVERSKFVIKVMVAAMLIHKHIIGNTRGITTYNVTPKPEFYFYVQGGKEMIEGRTRL